MVCGDICDQPLVPDADVELPADVEVPVISNGFVVLWLDVPDCAEDDFDVASDCRASHTDDAAPRANIMAGLRQTPRDAA